MPIHLEFIADTPAQLADLLGAFGGDPVKLDLTEQGDLYLSVDLREQDADEPRRVVGVDAAGDSDTVVVVEQQGDVFTIIDSDASAAEARAHEMMYLNVIADRLARTGDTESAAKIEECRARLMGVTEPAVAPLDERLIGWGTEDASGPAPRVHDGTIRVGDMVVSNADMSGGRETWTFGAVTTVESDGQVLVRWGLPGGPWDEWNSPETLTIVTRLDDDGTVEVWDHEDGAPVTVTDPDETPEVADPEPEVRPAARPLTEVLREWGDPVPSTNLMALGRADAARRPVEGDRVVHVGVAWPWNGPATRWIAPGAPIAHVVGANNDVLVLELPDGSESTVHPDKVAVVESVNATGDPIILLGDPPADDEPDEPEAPAEKKGPKNPPVLPGPGRPATVPSKYGPGTCPGYILEALDADPGRAWTPAAIAEQVEAKGFKASSVKASLSPLTRDGFIVRVGAGVYRSNLDG